MIEKHFFPSISYSTALRSLLSKKRTFDSIQTITTKYGEEEEMNLYQM